MIQKESLGREGELANRGSSVTRPHEVHKARLPLLKTATSFERMAHDATGRSDGDRAKRNADRSRNILDHSRNILDPRLRRCHQDPRRNRLVPRLAQLRRR
jgi:hypothetical protein